MKTINPAWKNWQALQNEGGEGYNPHPKWIERAETTKVSAPVTATDKRMVRDERGNYVPAHKLAASLADDIAKLSRITDASARAIVEASIAHARSQLGA